MEILILMAAVLALLTMSGWCFDWVFGGTVDPIYSEKPDSTLEYKSYMIGTCPNCGKVAEISYETYHNYGTTKCGYCQTEISEFEEKAV
ncbi:MAG: hypothetical protein ACFFAY_00810 [Promethearchaeota archaeon]